MTDHIPDGDGSYEAVELACHARVSWFDLRQLSATAAKTIAATIVGSMSGRRELMAALEPDGQAHFDLADRDDVWIDYVADCGDGWNASHSVAWLLGRDALQLATDRSASKQRPSPDCRTEVELKEAPGQLLLPAGQALIFGGDQVYPTASSNAYQERLVGPMRSARFCQDGGREAYAIPGNHDWYDGLTGFIRLFCQSLASRRWLGAWQTRQRRSYFAVALPHRWWLWGVDLALEDDLDPPQYDYFLAQAEKLQEGDQLILAVPTPVWLALEPDEEARRKELAKLSLVMDAALARKASIPLILTGDSHFYAHHRAQIGNSERDYVVCGGGGAFTLGTVQVPAQFALPDGAPANEKALFPTRAESARLRWNVLLFFMRNPAFTTALVAIQCLSLVLLRHIWNVGDPPPGFGTLLLDIGERIFDAPALIAWLLLFFGGFALFARSGGRGDRGPTLPTIVGGLHAAMHVTTALLLAWLLGRLAHGHGGLIWAVSSLGTLVAAYLLLGLIFGLYLAVSHWWFGMHNQEVYSAQAIEDWKCFLRIRIDSDGALVHPVGLRRSERDWVPAPGVIERLVTRGAWVTRRGLSVPKDCQRIMDPAEPLQPQLIEDPFRCGAPRSG